MRAPRAWAALLAAGVPLMLLGCGWEPLYGDIETEPVSAELRAIKVDPISERIGQRLAIALRNSLNPTGEPTTPRYQLSTTLTTGSVLLTNSVHVANSFDLNPNQYSTIVGEDDARNRCVSELDQEIVTRLAFFLQRRAAEMGSKSG